MTDAPTPLAMASRKTPPPPDSPGSRYLRRQRWEQRAVQLVTEAFPLEHQEGVVRTSDARVAHALTMFADKRGDVLEHAQRIAEASGLATPTVRTGLKRLERVGALTRHQQRVVFAGERKVTRLELHLDLGTDVLDLGGDK